MCLDKKKKKREGRKKERKKPRESGKDRMIHFQSFWLGLGLFEESIKNKSLCGKGSEENKERGEETSQSSTYVKALTNGARMFSRMKDPYLHPMITAAQFKKKRGIEGKGWLG